MSLRRLLLLALILLPAVFALSLLRGAYQSELPRPQPPTPLPLETVAGMVRLPAGTFLMGSPRATDHDAQPLHEVRLPSFWIDTHPVTNRQFEQFVQQSDYETDAEQRGSSLVFDRKLSIWREVVGVNWRHPEGPDSSLVGKQEFPVVHVTWQDAATFAAWAKKRLPTEAEFEYAARGGLADMAYPWGRELQLGEQYLANGWQGHFPDEDLGQDGYRGPSQVGKFPPNRFGLVDMAGNVCQWCADWYAADAYGTSLPEQPRGPRAGTERVRRGGSWLSAPNYGGALRVDYRDHALPSESTNHTGFRCVRDVLAQRSQSP